MGRVTPTYGMRAPSGDRRPVDLDRLGWAGVDACQRLLDTHLAACVQRFGAAALGVVDLPNIQYPGQLVAAQLRAASAFLWLREVERTGLLEFTDELSRRIADGRIAVWSAEAGARWMRYARASDRRFTTEERRALFEQVFRNDDPYGDGFDETFARLVSGLVEIGRLPADRNPTGPSIALAQNAFELAKRLSDAAVGITAFAARELTQQVGEALELLRDRQLLATMGALGSVWRMIERWSPSMLGRRVDPGPHLTRAEAGRRIVEWMADNAAALASGDAMTIARDASVIGAAERWRAATGGP